MIACIKWINLGNCYGCLYTYQCDSLLVTTVSPAKTAEPIESPFGGQIRVGPKHTVYLGATWQIRPNDPFSVAMRAVATSTEAT